MWGLDTEAALDAVLTLDTTGAFGYHSAWCRPEPVTGPIGSQPEDVADSQVDLRRVEASGPSLRGEVVADEWERRVRVSWRLSALSP